MSNEVSTNKTITINADNEVVVYLYDDVNENTGKDIVFQLQAMEQIVIEMLTTNEQLAETAKMPIPKLRFRISSCGGSMYDLLAITNMIERLKELGVTVITEANGYAMSAGFFLLLLGDLRTVSGEFHTELLYHTVVYSAIGKNGNMMKREIDRCNKIILKKFQNIMLEQTKVTQEMLDEYEEKDWLMDVSEARELEILNDEKLMKEYYETQGINVNDVDAPNDEILLSDMIKTLEGQGYKIVNDLNQETEEVEDEPEEKPKAKKVRKTKKSE